MAEKLKEGENNEMEVITLRLPAHEHYAIKIASVLEDKSINQWCRDALQGVVYSKTNHLSEMDIFKAKMTLLKESGNDKTKQKNMGISLEM